MQCDHVAMDAAMLYSGCCGNRNRVCVGRCCSLRGYSIHEVRNMSSVGGRGNRI